MTRHNIGRPEYVYDNLDKLPELVKAEGSYAILGEKCGVKPCTLEVYVHGYSLPSRESYNNLAEYFGWQVW